MSAHHRHELEISQELVRIAATYGVLVDRDETGNAFHRPHSLGGAPCIFTRPHPRSARATVPLTLGEEREMHLPSLLPPEAWFRTLIGRALGRDLPPPKVLPVDARPPRFTPPMPESVPPRGYEYSRPVEAYAAQRPRDPEPDTFAGFVAMVEAAASVVEAIVESSSDSGSSYDGGGGESGGGGSTEDW